MNYKHNYYRYHNLDICDALLCKICGKLAGNLHHITHKSQNGTDHPDNLIPLCMVCLNGHRKNNNPTTKQLREANE